VELRQVRTCYFPESPSCPTSSHPAHIEPSSSCLVSLMFELYFSQHQHAALENQDPGECVCVCVCVCVQKRDCKACLQSLESSVCVSSPECNTSLAHFCLTDSTLRLIWALPACLFVFNFSPSPSLSLPCVGSSSHVSPRQSDQASQSSKRCEIVPGESGRYWLTADADDESARTTQRPFTLTELISTPVRGTHTHVGQKVKGEPLAHIRAVFTGCRGSET